MSTIAREDLWQRLRGAALVDGETPAAERSRSPWYVRVMLGAAGWIGALFLLGFVGVGFALIIKSATASALTGALLCAGAVAIFRTSPEGDFTSQFGFAVSLVGQALLGFGFAQMFERSVPGIALTLAAQQVLLFVLVPNYLHRVWCAWTGAYAASFAMLDAGLFAFTPAVTAAACLWVWLAEFEHPENGSLLRAGGYGLALASVQSAVMHGSGWIELLWHRAGRSPLGGEIGVWLGAGAGAAVLLGAVLLLLRREGLALGSPQAKVAFAGAAILGAVSLKAPGIGPAVAILVVGYANGNRVLAGLGLAGLVGYLSQYYYSLQLTLLEKSALLAAAGAALLIARLALHRWWPEAKEIRDA